MMVNSSWTKAHIDSLVGTPVSKKVDSETSSQPTTEVAASSLRQRKPAASASATTDKTANSSKITLPLAQRITTVYPPCDTASLVSMPLENRQRVILSVAQFRPEKNHAAQLHALKLLLDQAPQFRTTEPVKLVMAGSVRNAADEARVEGLRELARTLGVEDKVTFAVNVPYSSLLELYGSSSIGLHTMEDEHFGITVVELMAAGLVLVVHASAGPFLDIVTPLDGQPTGFHAKTPQEFADRLQDALVMPEEERRQLRERARASSARFGEDVFERGWGEAWERLKAKVQVVS